MTEPIQEYHPPRQLSEIDADRLPLLNRQEQLDRIAGRLAVREGLYSEISSAITAEQATPSTNPHHEAILDEDAAEMSALATINEGRKDKINEATEQTDEKLTNLDLEGITRDSLNVANALIKAEEAKDSVAIQRRELETRRANAEARSQRVAERHQRQLEDHAELVRAARDGAIDKPGRY